MNPEVDSYLERLPQWQSESRYLRTILRRFPLEEQLKWAQPSYSLQGKNVVLVGGFKEYCALLFFKGALMSDPRNLLVAPGKTQAGRQIRFRSFQEIVSKERIINGYVREAIKVESAGLKVSLRTHSDYVIPDELEKRFATSPSLKKSFEALTPGRQRGYILFFSAPKQSTTREARVERCIERIFKGKGLKD